jgi:hypothetical protein
MLEGVESGSKGNQKIEVVRIQQFDQNAQF